MDLLIFGPCKLLNKKKIFFVIRSMTEKNSSHGRVLGISPGGSGAAWYLKSWRHQRRRSGSPASRHAHDVLT